MNYINRPKSAYTQEERIKYLEKSIRELRIEKDEIRKEKWEYRHKILRLEEENRKLKDEVEVWKNANKILRMHDAKMEYENKELKKEREMLIEDLSSDKELQQQIAQKQVDYYRENQKLKEELSKYKKQYEHSMWFSDFSWYDDNFNS